MILAYCIRRRPLLTIDEEREFFTRIADGDNEARQWVIECNLRLIYEVAKTLTGLGIDFDDLVGWGSIGLIRAVDMYDLGRGNRFASYAIQAIRQTILNASRDHSLTSVIRVPAHQFMKVVFSYESLGIESIAVREKSGNQFDSLDSVERWLKCLDDRERVVVVLRCGLDGGKERAFHEIGPVIGASYETARKLFIRSIDKMKTSSYAKV
jgi:RNA polymerase sigma factor (sigma-70 family)